MTSASRIARSVIPSRARPAARRGKRYVDRVRDAIQTPEAITLGNGMVERFDRNQVWGWVAASPGSDPVRVELRLNDRTVVTSEVLDAAERELPAAEARQFRFLLKDIWTYCRPQDRLSVTASGLPLPIAGHGTVVAPADGGTSTPTELFEIMRSGHVFSRSGQLRLSPQHNRQWQRDTLGLAAEVQDFVHERLGYDIFLIYGSLLGAIREKTVISHDTDIDMAYVSRHREGPAAAAEFHDLALAFVDAGWRVEPYRAHLHLDKAIDGRMARIDLFHLYFDRAGILGFPYGVAGDPVPLHDSWQGLVGIDFLGFPVKVPKQAEQVLAQIYGPGWRSPQPGFSWTQDRRSRAEDARMPMSVVQEIYWADYYAHAEVASASTFAEFVLGREDVPGSVVDIGCGNGRDSIEFASSGRQVLGIDGSPVAVTRATAAAQAAKLPAGPRFEVCDVTDTERLAALFAGARPAPADAQDADAPVLFYLRFFLHSIPQAAQDGLLATIQAAARPGDLFAAEFRTAADEQLEKAQPDHYRRYQDGAALVAELQDRGFAVVHHHEGTGLSPYRNEDPVLCRILARAT